MGILVGFPAGVCMYRVDDFQDRCVYWCLLPGPSLSLRSRDVLGPNTKAEVSTTNRWAQHFRPLTPSFEIQRSTKKTTRQCER